MACWATFPTRIFGQLDNMAIALAVLVAILLIAKFAKGFFANIAVLLGIIAGGCIAAALGKINFAPVANAPWLDFVYAVPVRPADVRLWSDRDMSIVMIVVMVESTGMFLALGEMTGKKVTCDDLTRGLRADGLGTLIGGIFNTFPYTSLLAERRPRRRHRRAARAGSRGGRRDPDRAGPDAEAGGAVRAPCRSSCWAARGW